MLLRLVLPGHLHLLDRLSLVDTATVFDDTLHLILFIRPVVTRQQEQLLAFVCRHNRTTVSNICHKALFADNKNDNSTAAATLMHWLFSISLLDETPLGLEAASCEGLGGIFREAWLVDDD